MILYCRQPCTGTYLRSGSDLLAKMYENVFSKTQNEKWKNLVNFFYMKKIHSGTFDTYNNLQITCQLRLLTQPKQKFFVFFKEHVCGKLIHTLTHKKTCVLLLYTMR